MAASFAWPDEARQYGRIDNGWKGREHRAPEKAPTACKGNAEELAGRRLTDLVRGG